MHKNPLRRNALAHTVRRAYRQDELARICTLPEHEFGRAFGLETIRVTSRWAPGGEDYYHFRDNGSRVLAVAHLDTVVRPEGRIPRFAAAKAGPLVVSGALDDRLGAYVILRLLPALGVTCDWLLTVGEESCASTAEFFEPARDYDWVIEFDRMGTDVVMYQYEDEDSRHTVAAAGAQVGQGSFSDITSLEHLGVKAFNWGVGYRGDYHSEKGYALLNDTFAMTAKYLRFHAQNAGTAMPHDSDDSYYRGYGGERSYDYYYDCDTCGGKDAVDSVTWYCTDCGACADCGGTSPEIAEQWGDPDVDVCQCYAPARRGSGSRDDRDWRAAGWEDDRPTGQAIPGPRDVAGTGIPVSTWHAGHFAGPQHAGECGRCAEEFPESAAVYRELHARPAASRADRPASAS